MPDAEADVVPEFTGAAHAFREMLGPTKGDAQLPGTTHRVSGPDCASARKDMVGLMPAGNGRQLGSPQLGRHPEWEGANLGRLAWAIQSELPRSMMKVLSAVKGTLDRRGSCRCTWAAELPARRQIRQLF